MQEQFVTYEIALKLKELDFDEDCLGRYEGKIINIEKPLVFEFTFNNLPRIENKVNYPDYPYQDVEAPLWQQVIDWFREKYGIIILQMCPIPPEAIKAAKGNLDNKRGFGFYLYNVNWNPRVPNLDIWEEDFYKGRKQIILKAIELISNAGQ